MRPALRVIIPSLVIQFACFLLNLGLGIFNFHRGSHRLGLVSFVFAGIISGLAIRNVVSQLGIRRLENRIFQLQQEANQMVQHVWQEEILMAYSPAVMNLARDNFMKVAKAIDATDYNVEAPYIRFKAKKRDFLLSFGGVQLLDKNGCCVSSTCWQNNYALPPLEAVAGVALLLYNKPELFEFWRDHRGDLAS